MAEPVTKKIDTLPAMEEPVATNDKLLILDVSDPATTMTKLITMNQVRISAAAQLDANVVENAKIVDGAVTSSKLAAGAVTAGKIASGGISASSQFAAGVVNTAALKDLNVTSGKLAAGAVTEEKLGVIRRTIVIRVSAPEDTLTVGSTTNFFPFPASLNSFVVVDARMNLGTPSSSGTVTVELKNQGGTMTTLSLAADQTGMSASGSISASYRTAVTNNFLGVSCTAAGTGAKGLTIALVLEGTPT